VAREEKVRDGRKEEINSKKVGVGVELTASALVCLTREETPSTGGEELRLPA